MKTIDVSHLACPGPVLKLRELLDAGETGVCLLVADELARSNVSRFAKTRGAEAVSAPRQESGFEVTIRGTQDSAVARPEEAPLLECDPQLGTGPTLVQITAATMGTGDDDLGRLLMRSFVKTQMQLEKKPDAMVFYNDGVRLCCEGSLLVEDLRSIAEAGVEIIACGTCLNFFNLADKLAVGRGTDMLEIASLLAGAGRVVRP